MTVMSYADHMTNEETAREVLNQWTIEDNDGNEIPLYTEDDIIEIVAAYQINDIKGGKKLELILRIKFTIFDSSTVRKNGERVFN